MKLFVFSVLAIFFLSTPCDAQQKPHYTQYILNQYILNPALSGIENYTDIKISHRHQWVGLQDAPVTTYLSVQGPIGKKDARVSATSLNMYGDNPRGEEYWDEYSPSAPHHGVGLQMIQDQSGPFKNFTLMGTYAYHIGLNAKTNLSAGIGLGFSQFTLNTNKLFFGIDFPVDPAITAGGNIGKARLDANAGLWLYSSNYFVGIAANQLVPQKLEYADNLVRLNNGKLVPHIFGTAGYRFLLTEDINLIPSVMAKFVSPVPMQLDFNAKVQFRDFLWAGATYRGKYGFAAMAGFTTLGALSISYSYDYSTTKLNTVSKGTHEILLGYMLQKKYDGQRCPRNLW
ncbi:MAG: type IX secretion system membrane protein PorP/SprF [Ferruginibacter sp.]